MARFTIREDIAGVEGQDTARQREPVGAVASPGARPFAAFRVQPHAEPGLVVPCLYRE